MGILWILVAALTCTGCAEQPVLTLSIAMSHRTYRVGDEIACNAKLRNVGESPLHLLDSWIFPNSFIRFDITDEHHKEVPYVGSVLKFNTVPFERWLEPGDALEARIVLYSPEGPQGEQEGFYRLDRPGRFTLTARYAIWHGVVKDGWFGRVSSEPVRFVILGDKQAQAKRDIGDSCS